MHDIVIRNALVVDGTGAPGRVTDVTVDGDLVTEVGTGVGGGRREIDAEGRILAPGWIDVHTHYDGQATWDPELTPSSWHGVTTAVMGNCGVGFAPVRRGEEEFLIELMEGVEDIPGTALHEGIDWRWEGFGEYLDALDSMPRTVDVAAQVPHTALRAFVMRDRAHEDASSDEIAEMADLLAEAVQAGAVGFTTSRTILHRSKHGLVPGTSAPHDELRALADAMGAVGGRRVFQVITDRLTVEPERSLLGELARRAGGPLTLSLAQVDHDPQAWRDVLDDASRWAAEGLRVAPQVATRPTGMLFGLQSSLHPFIAHPSYAALAELPLAERAAALRDPAVRERLLAEESRTGVIGRMLMSKWGQMFRIGDPPVYEPDPSTSAAAVAERQGRTPEEVVLDWLAEDDGRAFLFAPLAGFSEHTLDPILEMLEHPTTVVGLGDGGAHCGLICDASMCTYLLTHWVRDRQGGRLPLERAVQLQTSGNAELYGFGDRGTITPGKRADLNLIDLDALRIGTPEMTFDLPADARRIVQHAEGYDLTMLAGQVTYEGGEPTGARPGRLVRAG